MYCVTVQMTITGSLKAAFSGSLKSLVAAISSCGCKR